MRALFVIIVLAVLGFPSGHADASPLSDISPEELRYFHEQAAEGDVGSQVTLGTFYLHGLLGIPKDYALARQWYEKAATQGFAEAQFNLGTLYVNAQGVPEDYVRAYMWLNIAVAHLIGDEQKQKIEYREDIVRRMTPTQIEKAQRLSLQCVARKFKGC